MKKLLSLLGAIGLVATTGATVVACGSTTTRASVQNDVVTSQDYQVATQNITPTTNDDGTDPDVKLIENLDLHLRGYLDPIFEKLTGHHGVDITDDYEIQGITSDNLKDAIEAIKNGEEKFQLSGITVTTKGNAKYLRGEVVLPTITILNGSDFKDLLEDTEKVVIQSEDYLPTLDEVIAKLNEEIAKSTGELEKLKVGNVAFEVDGQEITVYGNGVYYGTFKVKLDSLKATDISTVIVPGQNDLGKMGFIKTPTTDQLFAILADKFGETYNKENLEIVSRDAKQTKLMGRNMLKGEAVVTYTRDTFDLNDIANKNLGALDEAPKTKQELIDKINEINDGLGLTEDLVYIAGQIGDTSAILTAAENSTAVNGAVQVEWSIKQFDLKDIITKTELGSLAISASNDDIVAAVNKLNETTLVLDKDVTVTDIKDVDGEVRGRTATLVAVENHPKYIGSVQIKWNLIADLTTKNIEKAITDLQEQNKLNFKVKVGSTAAAAKLAVTNEIKQMLSENYALPEIFEIEYSEFPDDEFLEKETEPNSPWVATPEAEMRFTLNAKDQPVVIKVSWIIEVVA